MFINYIRDIFLNFFYSNNHIISSSSSLIPNNDKSVLFTNCGMLQFKNKFLGLNSFDHRNITTSQNCLRISGKNSDLENIGFTNHHNTFFEMLGNFSFSSYYRKLSIFYTWFFLTRYLFIDDKNIYITVHYNDNNSYLDWQYLTSFDNYKIIKLNGHCNFWSINKALGPCGYCSEIYFVSNKNTRLTNNIQVLEIWNLVFMEYEISKSNSVVLLNNPCIDTGMGLERITSIIQCSYSNYSIDIFDNFIDFIKHNYLCYISINASFVIADHIRTICFFICNDIAPSNFLRGYVLRKIFRRLFRYIFIFYKKISILLIKFFNYFIMISKSLYPHINKFYSKIFLSLKTEEMKFFYNLKYNIRYLYYLFYVKYKIFYNYTFLLSDTSGFPLLLLLDFFYLNFLYLFPLHYVNYNHISYLKRYIYI